MVGVKLTADGTLPTEFRIWHYGRNTDLNDPAGVLFDERAAAAVMKAFTSHGTRLTFDVDHLSIDDRHPNYDGAAYGHFDLEVRNDTDGKPELWAVNVTWNANGAEQLREGLRVNFSPAFYVDEKNRPTRLINIALCARPATDGLQPLMAATERTRMKAITLALVLAASAAIKTMSQDDLVERAEGEGGGEIAGVNIAELATFLGVDIDPGQDPAGFVAAIKAKLQEIDGKLSGAAPAPEAEAAPPEEMAAAREIARLTATKTLTEAHGVVKTWQKLAVEQAETVARLEKDRVAIEDGKYLAMAKRLVACGAEFPATAYADPTAKAPTKASKHLRSQTLEDLETRAASFEAKCGGNGGGPLKPKLDAHGLTASEIKLCADKKIDPAKYAEKKAAIAARSGRSAAQEG